jgi:hypothetical protein
MISMADRIYVTYTPTTAPGAYHTTVHYERMDPAGNVVRHVTIEAKPEKLQDLSASDKAIGVVEEAFRADGGPSRFGRIDAHVEDQKPGDVPNAPYEIIAEGDDLSANLVRMQLFAHAVNVAGFGYRGDRQNSNSFAGAALQAGELPPAAGVAHDPAGPPGELLEFFAPGLNEPLRAPIGPRRETGDVARRSFDKRFGEWASSPAGPALPSAAGDPDSLHDRFGNWGSVPTASAVDTRSPVLRALEKYRTSAAPDGPVPTSAQGSLTATPAFQPVGTGGALGKFMEDHLITPAVAASSSLPALPGPTALKFASEESAFDSRSENAPDGPRPDTYPRLRRVSSAFPGFTPRDREQPVTQSEPAPLPGIFSGKPILPLPHEVWGLPDRSSVSPNDALFDFLAGLASRNPAPHSLGDDPRGFDHDDLTQPWFIQRQR